MTATKTTAPKATKTSKATNKTALATPAKKMSALDAAHEVLVREAKSLNAKELIAAMTGSGLWTSPGGKTPHATLYAAILREIGVKGEASRFRRTTKGSFSAATVAGESNPLPSLSSAVQTPKTKPSKAISKPIKTTKTPAAPAGEMAYEPLPA